MDASELKVGTIGVTVRFALNADAMRGRAGFKTGIRPNHWMKDREYTFVGQLDFVDRDFLESGSECTATVVLLIAEQDRERFVPGFVWQVGESVHIIGECTLLSIEQPYERLDTEKKDPIGPDPWLDPNGGTLLLSGNDPGNGWH